MKYSFMLSIDVPGKMTRLRGLTWGEAGSFFKIKIIISKTQQPSISTHNADIVPDPLPPLPPLHSPHDGPGSSLISSLIYIAL